MVIYMQGQKSANEMYHIGFRCKPSGTDSNAKLLTPGNGEAKAPQYVPPQNRDANMY